MKLGNLTAQMDRLYEFDREPVTPDKFQGPWRFAGLFAGEYVAATEFVIGAFFVLHGVSATAVIWGLLFGNVLSVMSWTFVCAPIATSTRLTMYWYLRRIAGPGFTAIYNVLIAVYQCIISSAMVSVAATSIALAVGVDSPELGDVLPTSVGWILITITIGLAMTVLAVWGFEKLSQFSELCSPWISVVFIAGAIAMLSRLGVHHDLSNLWEICETRIWTGVPTPGQEKYTFWHIVFFAWLSNSSYNLGLGDMAMFRYARHWRYGLLSAFGMYLGHTLAWICSGVMVAAVGRQMDAGLMAYEALGAAGALAVLISGWTTANPTLYRSGLALQCVTPNWPRWKVTLIAGMFTVILSCFPIIVMRLLNYVATWSTILVAPGAFVVAEHFLFPRLGIKRYRAEQGKRSFDPVATLMWPLAVGLAFWLAFWVPFHIFGSPLAAYLIALIGYTALRKLRSR